MRRFIICIPFLILCACSEQNTENNTAAEETQDKLFEHQREALEKAKEVEAMVKDAAAEQRKFIEDQGG